MNGDAVNAKLTDVQKTKTRDEDMVESRALQNKVEHFPI